MMLDIYVKSEVKKSISYCKQSTLWLFSRKTTTERQQKGWKENFALDEAKQTEKSFKKHS